MMTKRGSETLKLIQGGLFGRRGVMILAINWIGVQDLLLKYLDTKWTCSKHHQGFDHHDLRTALERKSFTRRR